jgi:DNA-binding CsgD family transcriptional regulator
VAGSAQVAGRKQDPQRAAVLQPERAAAGQRSPSRILVASKLERAAIASRVRREGPRVVADELLDKALRQARGGQALPGNLDPKGVGYLLKERVLDAATLVDALRRVCEGETVVDPTIVARLLGRKRRHDPLADLTSREREVVGLVAEGLSNRAIAERLVVTDRTVETHMTAIFGKLGLEESADQHRRVLAVLTLLRA